MLYKGLWLGEKSSKFMADAHSYIDVAINQVILGRYAKETNTLGILMEIGINFIPYAGPVLGAVADLRDSIHLAQHWEGTTTDKVQAGLLTVGYIPLVGDILKYVGKTKSSQKALKYLSNIDMKKITKELSKAVSDLSKGIKNTATKKVDEFVKMGKNFLDSTKNTVNKTSKNIKNNINKASDNINEVLKGLKINLENVIKQIENIEIPRLTPKPMLAGEVGILDDGNKTVGEVFENIKTIFSKTNDNVGNGVRIGGEVEPVSNL